MRVELCGVIYCVVPELSRHPLVRGAAQALIKLFNSSKLREMEETRRLSSNFSNFKKQVAEEFRRDNQYPASIVSAADTDIPLPKRWYPPEPLCPLQTEESRLPRTTLCYHDICLTIEME
ncbi:hypothetical protein TcWFU_008997 [Taenia crassiceps]|uniref:Uncharacterized protein n=1 Tax=Taenia crassiceps TaxID=6207 RepID=A0ABR4QIF7_9CEST